ncbi:MAG: hypothetical protein Q7S20_05710 [Gemmatimonadaceae bacterium]|nr:hypothetical protein [Gemmatimonadaceae bacterium]
MRYAAVAAFAMLITACERPNTSATAGDTMKAADTGTIASTDGATPAASSDEAKIAEAMSAAPDLISKTATIMDWPATEGGQPRQLRAGTSGWVCYPSSPNPKGAVGQDPMCLDPVFQEWAGAWMSKTPPKITGVGFAYMLKGDRGVSNTDPFATDSTATNNWVRATAHLMVVAPAATLASVSATPGGSPWVMWKGTPYAHVMMPVN